jgi:hypothetical protein
LGIRLEDISRKGGRSDRIGIERHDPAATIHGEDAVRGITADAGLVRLSDRARQRSGDKSVHGVATIGENPGTDTLDDRFADYITEITAGTQIGVCPPRSQRCCQQSARTGEKATAGEKG